MKNLIWKNSNSNKDSIAYINKWAVASIYWFSICDAPYRGLSFGFRIDLPGISIPQYRIASWCATLEEGQQVVEWLIKAWFEHALGIDRN